MCPARFRLLPISPELPSSPLSRPSSRAPEIMTNSGTPRMERQSKALAQRKSKLPISSSSMENADTWTPTTRTEEMILRISSQVLRVLFMVSLIRSCFFVKHLIQCFKFFKA